MKPANFDNLISVLNTANSYLENITKSIHNLSSDHWVMVSALASVLLGAVAVYAANKDYFNNMFQRPKIEIEKDVLNVKQDVSLISRLVIRNRKKEVAKNVTFWVENLWHYVNGAWEIKKNFLPFPLAWTHHSMNNEYMDLSVKRPYHLALCKIKGFGTEQAISAGGIFLYALHGGPSAHGLDDLKIGKNKIGLTLYCDNHKIKKYVIIIEWDGTFNYPKIEIQEE